MTRPGKEAVATASTVAATDDTARVIAAATLALVTGGALAAANGGLSPVSLGVAGGLWLIVCALVLGARHHHPYPRFGLANTVTTVRAAIAVLLGALAIEAGDPAGVLAGASAAFWFWLATLAAVLALALDGVDGALARASGLSSTFGARYDMETDAFLALALALLIWRSGELGAWVLLLGALRYAFVVATWLVRALRAPLFPSFRRKAVCVVQIAALCAIVSPLVEPPLSVTLGLAATLALLFSFAHDTLWLMRTAGAPSRR